LENTDENHNVTTAKIIKQLEKYNIPVERRTVYTDIDTLEDYGMEIERENGNYRVIERDFELYELQLLVDSVQSCKFITERKALELTKKLMKLASRHDRKTLERRSNYITNRIRSMNDSIFYHVDIIHECIYKDRKISFRYFTYTFKKEKAYMNNGKFYTVSPFALLWNDNNYYLVAYHDNKIKHFRVDKMEYIKAVDEKRDGREIFKNLDLSARSTKVFSMYGGEEERVTLRFSNNLSGVVIDRFGSDIYMLPDGEEHFTVSVNVEISPQFYGWLCGLGKNVKVISPDSVVNKMIDYVADITKMYETDTKT